MANITQNVLTPSVPKYRDFGEDIRLLAINLDLICYVVQRAQNLAVPFNEANIYTSEESQVLGNFRDTLSECEHLLNDQRFFTKCDGFVSDVSFYYQIDDEVQRLRDQIALHNIKVSWMPNGKILFVTKDD